MNVLQLQERFIGELLRCAPPSWNDMEVHYEHYPWNGQIIEKYIAKAVVGHETKDIRLSLDAIDVLAELNSCLPEGQSERWTWLVFRLDHSGKYKFDYKYGVPPLAGESIKYA